jgi:hypothetical protein
MEALPPLGTHISAQLGERVLDRATYLLAHPTLHHSKSQGWRFKRQAFLELESTRNDKDSNTTSGEANKKYEDEAVSE